MPVQRQRIEVQQCLGVVFVVGQEPDFFLPTLKCKPLYGSRIPGSNSNTKVSKFSLDDV